MREWLRNGASGVVIALLLSGCGGGGSGGGSATMASSPSQPQRPALQPPAPTTAQLKRELASSWSLRAVRGDAALAAGATGKGSVVALVDSGVTSYNGPGGTVDPTDFNDDLHPASATFRNGRVVAGGGRDDLDHGNWVASRIVSKRDGRMIVGIAPDARLMSLDADQSCGASCFRADDTAAAVRHAAANGADVINLSQGSSDLAGFPIASLVEATGQDVVIAAAAGNTGGSLIYPAAYAGDSRLGGKLVAVGSVGADLTLAASSSRPATPEQAEFYLVAPGQGVNATNAAGELQRVNGTSFATPLVSGAVAVLKARFPFMSGAQVVDLLLSSARDLGAAGTDLTYGRGMLDLGAALAPSGSLSLPGSDGSSTQLAGSHLDLGPAFGDALAGSDIVTAALAIDGLGRAYDAGLGRGIHRHDPAPLLQQRFDAFAMGEATDGRASGSAPLLGGGVSWTARTAAADTRFTAYRAENVDDDSRGRVGWAFGDIDDRRLRLGFDMPASALYSEIHDNEGLLLSPADMAMPALGLAGSGEQFMLAAQGLRVAVHSGDALQGDGGSVMIATRVELGGGFAVTHSLVNEDGAVLGSDAGGAFAGLGTGARTQFLGLSLGRKLAGWSIGIDASVGRSDIDSGRGAFGDWSAVWSSAFVARATGHDLIAQGDRLGIAFGQPLRVEDGSVRAELPVSQAADGSIGYASSRLDTTPSGRELRLELAYDRPLGEHARVQPWLMLRHEPDHVAQADDEAVFGLRFDFTW
ncbi:MAG: S8 family serine peptidase [Geminicoccaceae bacterium]|nr:S8 family serine peptidase [Geminicoccaceae bacterium]